MRREWIGVIAVVAVVVLAGCAGGGTLEDNGDVGGVGGGGVDGGDAAVDAGADGSVGVAVGGAQDANAFRTNVENGFVPQPTDVEYEGLFHDYYFDTGDGSCERRFCPSYSRAVSPDPLSGRTEHYLTVGLNSGLSQDFERPPLDLVVVVDTSGSMDSEIAEYHYDGDDDREEPGRVQKITVARQALSAMVDQLRPEDRLAVVAYDDGARVVQDLRRVEEISGERLSERLDTLSADGGTNLASGMDRARDLLSDRQAEGRLSRAVYVTDAMPNLGASGEGALHERVETDASQGVHTTFVGVGVDFNTRLTEALSDVRGANYYSVDSAESFRDRMTDGFKYMVTPLAFDLTVSVDAEGYRVERVYGAPGDDPGGELFSAATLFPSRREGNRTEGSVILVELERTDDGAGSVTLTASYERPTGGERAVTRSVSFAGLEGPHYDSTGVRKAVALTRYGSLMRNWAAHERALAAGEELDVGDGVEHRSDDDLGQWEQRSVDLSVSEPYGDRIAAFTEYFRAERAALGADRMDQDLAVLETLLNRTSADAGDGAAERVRTDDGDGGASGVAAVVLPDPPTVARASD